VSQKKVHRIPGPDGHTFTLYGTHKTTDAYVRMMTTHPDPDTCDDDPEVTR
jgi:hypothetical protein